MLYTSIRLHTALRNRCPAGMHPRPQYPPRDKLDRAPRGPVTLGIEETRPVEGMVIGRRDPASAPP